MIFDAVADRFTCIGDAQVIGFSASGEVVSRVEGNKIVHLIRERRSLVMGGVTASMLPDKPMGNRKVDAASLKDEAAATELLSVPEPVRVTNSKPRGRKGAPR
jgi:hypothetical protein